MKLHRPWPEGYTINARSPYGPRRHPITRKTTFHHGVDVALPVGTTLVAPADGVVVHKGFGSSGGHTLILKHDNNIHTVYYHLQKPSHLGKGTQVKLGDEVALSGNTGASTGPHLHWEVRRSRKWGDTIDPETVLVTPGVITHDEVPVPVADLTAPPVPTPEVLPPVKPKPVRKKVFPPTPMSAKLASFFAFRRNLR